MHSLPFKSLLIAAVLLTGSLTVQAADWRITPIRIDLDARSKTSAVTVINSSDQSLSFQVNATLWTQDASGKDLFTPTDDLIFFPRILTIEPNKERIIRAGVKIPATDSEKTYRLFIEEIASGNDVSGTVIAIKVRFGVPVFVAPLEVQRSITVADLRLDNNVLSATLINTGNTHVRPVSLSAVGFDKTGQEVFRNKIDGWYLLTASERHYSIPIAASDCRKADTIQLAVDGQYLDILETLPSGSFSCASGS